MINDNQHQSHHLGSNFRNLTETVAESWYNVEVQDILESGIDIWKILEWCICSCNGKWSQGHDFYITNGRFKYRFYFKRKSDQLAFMLTWKK